MTNKSIWGFCFASCFFLIGREKSAALTLHPIRGGVPDGMLERLGQVRLVVLCGAVERLVVLHQHLLGPAAVAHPHVCRPLERRLESRGSVERGWEKIQCLIVFVTILNGIIANILTQRHSSDGCTSFSRPSEAWEKKCFHWQKAFKLYNQIK